MRRRFHHWGSAVVPVVLLLFLSACQVEPLTAAVASPSAARSSPATAPAPAVSPILATVSPADAMKLIHPKLDQTLSYLYGIHRDHPEDVAAFAAQHGLDVSEGQVLVTVSTNPATDRATVERDVAALQGQVVASYQADYDIRLPIEAMPRLADLPYVPFVAAPSPPRPLR